MFPHAPSPERDRDHDPGLLERAAAGDSRAVTVLLDRYLVPLRAAVRLCGDASLRHVDARSDLVRSVVTDLIRGPIGPACCTAESFRAWLFTATLETVRRHAWLARFPAPGPLGRLPSGWDLAAQQSLFERYARVFGPRAGDSEAAHVCALEAGFLELAPGDRELLVLARIAALPHAQLAEWLGGSVAEVRARLGEALCALGEILRRKIEPEVDRRA